MCRISVTLDDKKEQEFKRVLSDLGISTSDAIRLYVDAVIKDGDIPKYVDPFYDSENIAMIKKSADDMERGLSEIHPLVQA